VISSEQIEFDFMERLFQGAEHQQTSTTRMRYAVAEQPQFHFVQKIKIKIKIIQKIVSSQFDRKQVLLSLLCLFVFCFGADEP
jgi:hypothetical protein